MQIRLLLIALLFQNYTYSQFQPKKLQAVRTYSNFKIDGNLDEDGWKVPAATNFIEQRPNAGRIEDYNNRTEIYLVYDNISIYVGGYCYEQSRDSISRELVGRDKPGINDLAGIMLDTYHDKINAVGFYITPYGEQFDQKYLPPDNRDVTWNAVWQGASKIHKDGWSFEIRIPYSALRFLSKENQTWGLNFIRTRTKKGQQFTWSPVNPEVSGFVNQAGEWTGIGKIDAPVRLSLSPYISSYINYYKPGVKDWRSAVNGGIDVKYGINESFTLDMTLIPDFGQVQSDNQVLNLSPFEIQFNENRSFFTEGTELFNIGDLFYSRRIGSRPIYYNRVLRQLAAGETIIKNPQESRLINATKISGRTKNGLGIGFFNAVTNTMYAEVQNANKEIRKIETNPLTNYNIIVLDQTLNNNSSVSFINTNVIRNGADYDANVSAGLFRLNNKKNTYSVNGKFAVSQITQSIGRNSVGYSHTLGFNKTGGRLNFQIVEEIADKLYNINDMGLLFNNNYINHYFWAGYRWIVPKAWYNRIHVNYNATYSQLFSPFENQLVKSKYQIFSTNVNANAQFKNLWAVGVFASYTAQGNDFYEPLEIGRSFRTPRRLHFTAWVESNSVNKYSVNTSTNVILRDLFNGFSQTIHTLHRYRFNDKFSITQSVFFNRMRNDAGFYSKKFQIINGNRVLQDIIFARRDRKTIENIFSAKYNFNNKAGITFRARHYWSKVNPKQLFDLSGTGELTPTIHTGIIITDQNANIFNIDAVYTWQFAPGSFINVVWKDEGDLFNDDGRSDYFRNFDRTLAKPHNNNLSVKIIWFLDYLDIKKWRQNRLTRP